MLYGCAKSAGCYRRRNKITLWYFFHAISSIPVYYLAFSVYGQFFQLRLFVADNVRNTVLTYPDSKEKGSINIAIFVIGKRSLGFM